MVVFNHPERVAVAANKLETLACLEQNRVSIPKFTTDIETARQWVRAGRDVFQRKLLRSSEGRGIVVANSLSDIIKVKLYTRGVPKKREYRVHVAFGEVIGFKRKIKHKDIPITGDPRIRCHANGYRFILDPEHTPPQCVLDEALRAVQALQLDYGGVDVMWTERNNKAYILEVNTAPGLTDITGSWYVEAFRRKMNER